MNTKLLFFVSLICGFFSHNSLAQGSLWVPVGGKANPINYIQKVNGRLFGHVITDSTWEIKEFNGSFWQGSKPITQFQGSPEDFIIYNGKLHALTSEKCYRLDGLNWTVIFSGYNFERIVEYNNRLILQGNFTQVNGVLTAGLAWFDGVNFGALQDINGDNASLTGNVHDIEVYKNKLYLAGNIYNTHKGTILSNIVVWNDTLWAEGFNSTFPNPKPIVTDLLVKNGDLYFNTEVKNKRFGVYKLNGTTPVPLDSILGSLHPKIQNNANVDSKIIDFNGSLHGVMRIYDTLYIQSSNYYSPIEVLMSYNGTYWEMTQDTLNYYFQWNINNYPTSSSGLFNKMEAYKNSLYAFCSSPLDPTSFISRLFGGPYYSINPEIVDLRKPFCHVDSADRQLEGMVRIDGGNFSFYHYSSTINNSHLALPKSNPAQVILENQQLPYYSPAPCSDSVIQVSPAAPGSVVFFQKPITPVYDVRTFISGNTGALCRQGFDQTYTLDVKNIGTEPVYNISVSFNYPTNSSYISSSISPSTNINQTLEFSLDTLNPSQTTKIEILLNNSLSHTLGSTVFFHSASSISPITDMFPANDVDTLEQTVVAAYDPNSKQVNYNTVSQWGGTLDYQINFQNLGTDTAFNVVVVDSLPQHILPGTFKMISSSDAVEVSLTDHYLVFSFPNIRLPDSASYPEESKGFVRFHIDMKTSLSNTDTIKNRGHIYFDFQPAVITNYAKTYKSIGIGIKEDSKTGLKLYPNPNKGIFYAEAPDAVSLDLINVTGQQVDKLNFESGTNQIDLQHLPAGLYFLVGDDYVKKIQIVR